MLNENIQPSSIDGIKRLANQIKKSKGLPHHEALNVAAKAASFENFAHARGQLKNHSKATVYGNQLFLSVYWYDRDSYSTGRETLEINLSKPLLDICTKYELKNVRGLGRFRQAAKDHLVKDDVDSSQNDARRTICAAVRALRFMEATGLKPSRDSYAAYPDKDSNNKLPKSDHSTDWHDPLTGQFILIDEPYLDMKVNIDQAALTERAAWAKKHGWHLQASKWPGMYNPYDCSLFVATDASTEFNFGELINKIDAISEPLIEDDWDGISANNHDVFASPLAKTSQDIRRAKAKGTIWRLSTKKTVPLRLQSSYDERRPNAVMPIADHQNAALMIKAILQSSNRPWNVNSRLNTVRSRLEDWFFSEHSKTETDKHDLFYYGEIEDDHLYVLKAQSKKGNIELLKMLKSILKKNYIDCEPLKNLVQKIDTSISYTKSS